MNRFRNLDIFYSPDPKYEWTGETIGLGPDEQPRTLDTGVIYLIAALRVAVIAAILIYGGLVL